MGLDEYSKKRDFNKTPEPQGSQEKSTPHSRFVVQRHQARRLHFDLRLEMEGVLKSWAIPKGPSQNPQDKRLAVQTEDHPLEYLTFQGTIPKGNYGAGEMTIWDTGTYRIIAGDSEDPVAQLKKGDLKLEFFGHKLKGTFALVRTQRGDRNDHWLLIKKKDEFSTSLSYDANEYAAKEVNEDGKTNPFDLMKPMLATKTSTVFSKPGWIYEIKWDGYRLISNIQKGKVTIYSRNGISYNHKFQAIAENLKSIPHDVILDGEVVVLNEEGIPDFQQLHNYPEGGTGELRYYVFDILYLNGHETTSLPLLKRKSLIPEVIEGIPLVFYCDHVESMGNTFFQQALDAGLEGIIAKKADAVYTPGIRTENWLKIKGVESQEALICGYTESEGALFGSLILGLYEEGELKYIGNCGSGFTDALQKELLQEFKSRIKDKSPFDKKINLKSRKPIWLEPELICEVKFSNWTNSGSMRHPVFKALRTDKIPQEIRKEEKAESPQKAAKANTTEAVLEVGGIEVPISNLEKVYWPDQGITKYQLIDYYLQIADTILPYLKDRPQNLHRHPNGIDKESFYQKDTAGIFPPWIETVPIYSSSSNKEIEYMLCQNEATLLYMANLGCIEINPWNSKKNQLDHPDYTVIDIDPSDKNTFDQVIEVAQAAYSILQAAEIPGFCKTSGSSGLHIYLPLGARYTYEEGRDFSKLLCYLINEQLPKLTTLERKLDQRKGRIYLDYLQNRRGQTLAATYCVRPKPEAPVSAPLEWKEVKQGLRITDFNIFNMPERLEKKSDLFKDVLVSGIEIEKTLEKLDV
jgi:bifunctional non-homologous end joining protein LigD